MPQMRSRAITKPVAVELGLQCGPCSAPEQLGNPIIRQVEVGDLQPAPNGPESAGGQGGVEHARRRRCGCAQSSHQAAFGVARLRPRIARGSRPPGMTDASCALSDRNVDRSWCDALEMCTARLVHIFHCVGHHQLLCAGVRNDDPGRDVQPLTHPQPAYRGNGIARRRDQKRCGHPSSPDSDRRIDGRGRAPGQSIALTAGTGWWQTICRPRRGAHRSSLGLMASASWSGSAPAASDLSMCGSGTSPIETCRHVATAAAGNHRIGGSPIPVAVWQWHRRATVARSVTAASKHFLFAVRPTVECCGRWSFMRRAGGVGGRSGALPPGMSCSTRQHAIARSAMQHPAPYRTLASKRPIAECVCRNSATPGCNRIPVFEAITRPSRSTVACRSAAGAQRTERRGRAHRDHGRRTRRFSGRSAMIVRHNAFPAAPRPRGGFGALTAPAPRAGVA